MAEDYITVDDLAGTLSLGSETFADADLQAAITAASREVDRLTNRKFSLDSVTRYYTPTDAGRLWIDDANSISSVAVDVSEDGSFAESWVLNTDYVPEPLNAAADGVPFTSLVVAPRTSRYFPVGQIRAVRVGGQFGWSAVPAVVKQATTILAARLAKRSREAPFGVAGFGIDGGAVRVSSFDPDVERLLAGLVRTNHQ